MMRAVCQLTRPYGIQDHREHEPHHDRRHRHVRRLSRSPWAAKPKFACVDGPDFDGHLVDFDEAMKRSRTYRDQEEIRHGEAHLQICTGEAR